MKINIQKLNPLKPKDQRRDSDGKFTAGSGGLQTLKKFNWKRNLPIIVVVAAVGGFLVFQSFASVTKPPKYQYSIATCTNKKITADDVKDPKSALSICVDESAEALSYRLQQAALGRQTDWGYNSLPQRLAGDRTTTGRVAQVVEALPEGRWGNLSNKDYVDKVAGLAKPEQRAQWTKMINEKKLTRSQLAQNVANLFKISVNKVMMPSYKYNNKQYVEHIFKALLKRGDTYVASPKDFYIANLDAEKWSRAQVLNTIAQSSEAKSKTRVDIVNYVNSKPKLKIVQTAMQKQTARNQQLAALVSSSKTHYEKGSLYHQKAAASLPGQAAAKANQSWVNRGDLTAIANMQKDAQNRYNYAQLSANNAQNDLKKAETILKAANAVTEYSPDISNSTAKSSRDKVLVYATAAKGKANEAKGYISKIAASYKAAETKYQNQCNSGTDYNGSSPGCGSPPPPTHSGPETPTGAVPEKPVVPPTPTGVDPLVALRCYNRSGNTQTRKIDGGRTTQKRVSSWYINGSGNCVEKWGSWKTTSTQNGSEVQPPALNRGICKVGSKYVQYMWVNGQTLGSVSYTSSRRSAKTDVSKFGCGLVSGRLLIP